MKRCAFLLLILTACAARVTSSLQVDGTAFAPTTCRSGQAFGFAGVELADDQQRRLRLVQALDGTFQAVYFPPGHPVGQSLGSCGTLKLRNGTAVVNGIRNVEGNATLNCGGGANTVKGSVSFDRCH